VTSRCTGSVSPTRCACGNYNAVAEAAIGLGCHRSALQSVHADPLPLPHRTDTAPAADAGAGVRVRPGGVQRRIAGPRRGVSGWNHAVGFRDSAPRDHRGEDDRAASLAVRGAQCGVGAVGERLPPRLAQLLRLSGRETQRPQGRSATAKVTQGSPAIVAAHPQRILSPAQRAVVCGQGGRGAGALVDASCRQRTVVSHDHSGTRWHYYASFVVDVAAAPLPVVPARSAWMSGSRGWRRSPPPMINVSTSPIRNTWAASSANCAVGAGEIPPAERISQQGQEAAQGRRRAQRGGACSAGLSPQAGFGVGSRQPSDPRRRPQHRGDGRQPPFGAGDLRCRMGAVRADHRREGRPLRTYRTSRVAVAGVEQDMLGVRAPARRTPATDPAVGVPSVPGGSRPRPQRRQGHSRRRAGGETKRLWSPGKSSQHWEGARR
jgi:hypothetical protein